MASVVQICNAALTHLGDSANVLSISPPDGSAQSRYCATFYPLALSAILETANWSFATVRSTTAPVDNPSSTWAFAYAYPAQVVTLIAVLEADALSDYSYNFSGDECREWPDFRNPADNHYAPQAFDLEQDGSGGLIILTNVENAVFRYTKQVSDPSLFPGLFVMALSYLLASMLAGPIIKGDTGRTVAAGMLQTFGVWNGQAKTSDANQRKVVVEQRVSWMAGR